MGAPIWSGPWGQQAGFCIQTLTSATYSLLVEALNRNHASSLLKVQHYRLIDFAFLSATAPRHFCESLDEPPKDRRGPTVTHQFFGYPLLSQAREKLRIWRWPVYSEGPCEQIPLKILEKRKHGRIQGLLNFFRVPPIISRKGKATDFKFCMLIYRLNRNKSPLKISGYVAVGVVRDSRKFLGHRAHHAVIFAIAQLSCLSCRRLQQRWLNRF